MSIDAELLLQPDVEICPVRNLAPQMRANIDAGDEDYALTRGHSRSPSRIVDRESADLLGAFRTPTRIVDAVLSFAARWGVDAESTLEESYPLLYQLYQSKMLVPADSADARPTDSELRTGSVIEGFRLLRCIQILDDNEVFLARNIAGQYAAVKFYRKLDERIAHALEHEAAVLRQVPNKCAPEFLHLTRQNSGIALITEWVFGSEATIAAAVLRGRHEARCEGQLLSLSIDIVRTFAEVHESGVLHGDVHPRNVLVEPNGAVRLIDFGMAQFVDQVDEKIQRGGVAFFYDPQFAEAQRHRKEAALTAAGEQYSVAALLYLLWTGVYYLDWSLERDALFRQVAEEPPVSFEKHSTPPWPALEDVLHRALDKHPEQRYESMSAFAEHLRLLMPEAQARDQNATVRRKERARENELLERMLQRYSLGGDALSNGLLEAPLASLNYGAGGVAYALFRIAQRRCDARLLALADVWTQKALALSTDPKAFYNSDLEIDPETVGDASLFHSVTGLQCLRALVSTALGDISGANYAIQSFVDLSRRSCDRPDLTLGKASLLLGCAELLETIPVEWVIDSVLVRTRGEEIANELEVILKSDSISTSTRITLLGIAHGWGGLIFALLRWARATGTQPDPVTLSKLDELAMLAEPHAGGVRWPVHNSTSTTSFMEGWCNGTAGHVMLFALAHSSFPEKTFGELAERAATCAWSVESRIGTLCCGLGGIGYAFLAVHRLVGSRIWLDRARTAARRAAADSSKYFMRDALYKGAVGVALLAEHLKQPEISAMPLFEPQ